MRMWGSVWLQAARSRQRAWESLERVRNKGEGIGSRREMNLAVFLWAGVVGAVLVPLRYGFLFAPYSPFMAFGVDFPGFGLKAATRPLWALTWGFVGLGMVWPGLHFVWVWGLAPADKAGARSRRCWGSYGCFLGLFLLENRQPGGMG